MGPESVDNFLYVYNKSLPIKEQVLFSDGDFHLLNVRLQYTNKIYFGVHWTVLHKKSVSHYFKCKDRGYTESCKDSLDSFFSHFRRKRDVFGDAKASLYKKKHFTFVPQQTHINSVYGREVDIYFAFENDKYRFTNIVFKDDNCIMKGLYAPKKELFITEGSDPFKVGYVLDEDTTPTVKDLDYFHDKCVQSLSNVNTVVNTEYSNIKIY